MFVDEIEITIRAGKGGAGKVSFFPGLKSGPDGGNGGRGGSVYIKPTRDLMALRKFAGQREFVAQDGQPGGSNCKFGRKGKNLELKMPVGSVLTDQETGQTVEIKNFSQKEILVCRGGTGGKGNVKFKSPSNTTPRYAQGGFLGEEKRFKVVLKLIADLGLIGLPNAGKSSLLKELTAASPKIANYPFTTLEPNLGVLGDNIIADIPGLIQGASGGKGLGIKFLKHIEKVGLLVHCVSAESTDVKRDYRVVMDELGGFDVRLAKKKQIILLTKTDLLEKSELDKKINELKKFKERVLAVSIHDWDSLEKLKKILAL